MRRETLIPGVLVAVAFLLGVAHLGAHGMWYDEAYSLAMATSSFAQFSNAMMHVDGPIITYYMLLRSWFFFLPPTVESARLLSLIFACASIPLIYQLGKLFGSQRAGLYAAGLLAFNSSWWIRAEDARTYAIALFFSLLSFVLYARAQRDGRGYPWLVAALTATFAFQVVVGGTVLLALATTFLLCPPERKKGLALALGFACLELVILVGFFSRLGHTDSGWLAGFTPTLKMIGGNLLLVFGARYAFPFFAFAIGFVIALALLRGYQRREIQTLVIWSAVPVLAVLATIPFHSLWIDRYLVGALAPFLTLVALGIASLKPQHALILGTLVLSAEAFETIHADRKPHETWVGIASVVDGMNQADLVVADPRGAQVAITQELAAHPGAPPLHTTFWPPQPETQWQRGNFEIFPLPDASQYRTIAIIYYGFENTYDPNRFAPLYDGHHECGRLSTSHPMLVMLCRNREPLHATHPPQFGKHFTTMRPATASPSLRLHNGHA
jgi:hypothetical protein